MRSVKYLCQQVLIHQLKVTAFANLPPLGHDLNGCTMDKIEVHGRWRTNVCCTLDRYDNVEQQHINSKIKGKIKGGIVSLIDNESLVLVLVLPLR